MIHKLIQRLFSTTRARHITPSEHHLSAQHISSAARQVVSKLQDAGFSAYVVGGAVRDLLLGKRPKDFDIATNATPEQIVPLFRRARIIGKRFRIVHVLLGKDLIEVTTLRSHTADSFTDEHGRILHDNKFGETLAEDAARRDFTINALYFDPTSLIIHDFQSGFKDLQRRQLKMIGEPSVRYREDPIRMLRAVRLAAKLGFDIEAKTHKAILKLSSLITNVPSARFFDETLKLLTSGCALNCLQRLRQEKLDNLFLPILRTMTDNDDKLFVEQALANTDKRVAAGKSVSPTFLMATLLWPSVCKQVQIAIGQHAQKPWPALAQAITHVLSEVAEVHIPKRFEADMREIWMMQPRFEQCHGQRPFKVLEHPRFRAGYDFMLLRAQTGEISSDTAEWWTVFQSAEYTTQQHMVQKSSPQQRRRKTNKSKNATTRATTDLPPT